jgi:hypothetical protein
LASGDELRDSVAELLTSRYSEVETEREFGGKRVDIYFVESRTTGRRRIAVECKDYNDTLGVDTLERILASYDRLRREGAFDEYWIVTRNPLTPKARELVRDDPNVHAITFGTLQRNIFDVRNYVRALEDEFLQSGLGQYYIESTNETGRNLPTHVDAWLQSDTPRPLAVLAGYGMGKSSLAKYIAYQYAQGWLGNHASRIPILIELAAFSQQQRLEGVISSLMAADYNIPGFHFHTFMQLNRAGRFLIILDGFDEMKHCMTIDEFTYNWRQLCRLVTGRSKVLLFGRPSIFTSDDELTLFLHGTVKADSTALILPDAPNFLTEEISFFDRAEVSEFIPKYVTMLNRKLEATHNTPKLSDEDLRERIAQVGMLDYDELLKRPIHAKLVCDVAFGNPSIDLTTFGKYELYDQVVRRLCSREDEKPGRSSTGIDRRVEFSRELAWWAWTGSKHGGFTASELPGELIQRFSDDHRSLEDGSRRELLAGAAVDTKRALRYHFAHRSILEFLVADYAINAMDFQRDAATLSKTLNDEIVLFLKAYRNDGFARNWLKELSLVKGNLSLKFILTIMSILDGTTELKDHSWDNSPWNRKTAMIYAVYERDLLALSSVLDGLTETFSSLQKSNISRLSFEVNFTVDPELASLIHCAIILYDFVEEAFDVKQLLLHWTLRTILQFSEPANYLDCINREVSYSAPISSRICTRLLGNCVQLVRASKQTGATVIARLPGLSRMTGEHGEQVGVLSDPPLAEGIVRMPLDTLLDALPDTVAERYREFRTFRQIGA